MVQDLTKVVSFLLQCDFPGCGRRFTTVYNLNTHKKLHERPCTQECPECGLKFPTMRKLDLHLKNHIGAQKTYKWVDVGKVYFLYTTVSLCAFRIINILKFATLIICPVRWWTLVSRGFSCLLPDVQWRVVIKCSSRHIAWGPTHGYIKKTVILPVILRDVERCMTNCVA